MRRALLITLSTALAVITAACDFGGGGTDVTTITQSPSAVPTGQPTPTPSPSPAQSQPRGIVLPDLISSTDPNQRIQQIESSRSDPFALIPTTPRVELPRDANGRIIQPPSQSVPGTPTVVVPRNTPQGTPTVNRRTQNTRNTPQGTRTANRRTQNTRTNRSTNRPGTLAPIPNLVGRAPTTPIAPPPPSPDLARAVQVSGVVQIGNTAFAIVNAPNEPTSRYVKAGQRLSNGQVLVRRIEMNAGSEPVVVLEQYGVEVVRSVESGAPTPSATPAASAPSSNQPT